MAEPPPEGGGSSCRVFDRERYGPPWNPLFSERRPLDVGRQWAVAANWRMDHRVSEAREHGDLKASGHFGSMANLDDWWRAQSFYFQEELCRSADSSPTRRGSAYCQPPNSDNKISVRIPGFDELVHVGSLNGMLRRAATFSESAADVDIGLREIAGRGLPSRPGGTSGIDAFDRQVDDLAGALIARGEDSVRQAAGLLLDALGEGQPPWWAAFAEEASPAIRSGSARELCKALGLGHYAVGEWLLVWRYPVREAGPLYRPTVLESNGSPWHFPSPPEYPWGITMPLHPTSAACREVLHQPLRELPAVDRCTGKILHLVESLPAVAHNEELLALRAQHRERLRREFPATGLGAWLDRNPEVLA